MTGPGQEPVEPVEPEDGEAPTDALGQPLSAEQRRAQRDAARRGDDQAEGASPAVE